MSSSSELRALVLAFCKKCPVPFTVSVRLCPSLIVWWSLDCMRSFEITLGLCRERPFLCGIMLKCFSVQPELCSLSA